MAQNQQRKHKKRREDIIIICLKFFSKLCEFISFKLSLRKQTMITWIKSPTNILLMEMLSSYMFGF